MDYTFLENIYFGNTIRQYLICLGVFFALLALFKIFQAVALHRLKKLAEKTKTDIDDMIIKIVEKVKPPFYLFLSLYVALYFISVNAIARKAVNSLLIIMVFYQLAVAVQILINFVANKAIYKDDDKSQEGAIKTISFIAKLIVWSFGLILVLGNIGINVTSLVAGLGVAGIAVALALQNILSDLFSSFAIHFDKPFVVGDFIVVGKHTGVVEKIGIKTTRIRALQGEEIVISNQELTSARIHNFKKMKERRISLDIGVVYKTKADKLKKIPVMIKNIIDRIPQARFDRAHFKSFNDSNLGFEIVYFVESKDYADYMDTNQKIHLKIKESFEKEKIEFAFPTQSIYMEK